MLIGSAVDAAALMPRVFREHFEDRRGVALGEDLDVVDEVADGGANVVGRLHAGTWHEGEEIVHSYHLPSAWKVDDTTNPSAMFET